MTKGKDRPAKEKKKPKAKDKKDKAISAYRARIGA